MATETKVLLLDLGDVVMNIDFRRVFKYWSEQSQKDQAHFYEHWAVDDAYKAHETGEIDFAEYSQHLQSLYAVNLSDGHWRAGWNCLFIELFPEVEQRLLNATNHLPLYAFSNTNPTHQQEWLRLYPQMPRLFRHIFVSSEISLRKPDTEAYRHVHQAIATETEVSLQASEICFLDDSPDNIRGAKEAGFNTVLVRGPEDVIAAFDRFGI